jgi:protein-S-isoprenylcysteine O-methyltransferase Ste14
MKEKQKEQSILITLCAVLFVLGFIAAGLDFRFSISGFDTPILIIFSILFLLAYIMYARVLFENEYLSRTIKTEKDQRVVDTGLYGIIRHPMYLASIVLFLSVPFVLGSLVALPFFLLYPFVIVKRIKYEEKLLDRELLGYKEYKEKVKYRLIPFIW